MNSALKGSRALQARNHVHLVRQDFILPAKAIRSALHALLGRTRRFRHPQIAPHVHQAKHKGRRGNQVARPAVLARLVRFTDYCHAQFVRAILIASSRLHHALVA